MGVAFQNIASAARPSFLVYCSTPRRRASAAFFAMPFFAPLCFLATPRAQIMQLLIPSTKPEKINYLRGESIPKPLFSPLLMGLPLLSTQPSSSLSLCMRSSLTDVSLSSVPVGIRHVCVSSFTCSSQSLPPAPLSLPFSHPHSPLSDLPLPSFLSTFLLLPTRRRGNRTCSDDGRDYAHLCCVAHRTHLTPLFHVCFSYDVTPPILVWH